MRSELVDTRSLGYRDGTQCWENIYLPPLELETRATIFPGFSARILGIDSR